MRLWESLCLGFGKVCGKLEKDRSRYCGNEVGYDSDIDRWWWKDREKWNKVFVEAASYGGADPGGCERCESVGSPWGGAGGYSAYRY